MMRAIMKVSHGHAYEKCGVDASKGCVVILRPDQYIWWIGQLEDVEEMDQYFSGFMVPRSEEFDHL
jgi:phenol 2-monooxygenase